MTLGRETESLPPCSPKEEPGEYLFLAVLPLVFGRQCPLVRPIQEAGWRAVERRPTEQQGPQSLGCTRDCGSGLLGLGTVAFQKSHNTKSQIMLAIGNQTEEINKNDSCCLLQE